MLKNIAIIPSRLDSTRFPNKPLKEILGMPMIGHCFHRAKMASNIDEVYVATCDQKIADYINSIGGQAIMTSSNHKRASTRSAEALEIIEKEIKEKIEIIVMVQGDEPMISPEIISQTLPNFSEKTVNIVNIISRIQSAESFTDKNNVKVVFDSNFDALYFSREPIPSAWNGMDHIPKYMQTGVIAFRRSALLEFNKMRESELEIIESIDMNRVLEHGGKIRIVPTDELTIGVDVPEELEQVEKILLNDSIAEKYLGL